jgi:CBS-domain-containing membrane protein
MSPQRSLLERAKSRYGRLGAAAYSVVLSLVVLTATGLVGVVAALPWLFPSLGPTVMLFFESPEQPAARPMNTIVGHGVGITAGALCLFAFGLQGDQPAPVGGLNPGYDTNSGV